MPENLHEGHRQRVRTEFLENGFGENTPPHKFLEMLLFYSIPRRDTNALAHKLIEEFGSLAGVLDASAEELMKIPGITENTAVLLKLIVPVARRYQADRKAAKDRYESIDDICDFLLSKYFGYSKEVFAVTSLSLSGRILGFDILASGEVSAVAFSSRKVIETVLKRNAACVIISHNHPDGPALPSSEDIEVTVALKEALAHVNVKLADHIIISDGDYVSLAHSRGFAEIFGQPASEDRC